MKLFRVGKSESTPQSPKPVMKLPPERYSGEKDPDLNTSPGKKLMKIVNDQKERWNSKRLAEIRNEPDTAALMEYMKIHVLELCLTTHREDKKDAKEGLVLRSDGFTLLELSGSNNNHRKHDICDSHFRIYETDIPTIKQKICQVVEALSTGEKPFSIEGLREQTYTTN